MSLAGDLRVYVDANSTRVTVGTSLFQNAIPETTGRAVFIIETRGREAVEKFGGLPAMVRPRADIIARSSKAVGGAGLAGSTGTEDLIKEMWDILVTPSNTTINSKTYQRVTAETSPYLLGRDEAGRALFGFSVQAMASASTN